MALMVASFSANALLTLALRECLGLPCLGLAGLALPVYPWVLCLDSYFDPHPTTSHTHAHAPAVPAFITPMVLFSGFLYDTATLPPYLAWLPKVSIVNYGFSAMVRAPTSTPSPHPHPTAHPSPSLFLPLRLLVFLHYTTPQVTLQQGLLPADVRPAVLRFTNVDPTALGQSILVLLAMTVAFYVVAYVSLALRLRAAKRA